MRRMLRRTNLLIRAATGTSACALMISGCGTAPRALAPEVLAKVAAAEPCCASISALPTRVIESNATATFAIDESSPYFRFAEGKAPFLALALPQHSPGATIVIRSFSFGIAISTRQAVEAAVIWVDESGREISRSDEPSMAKGNGSGLTGNCFYWEKKLPLPRKARTAVLFTSPKRYNEPMQASNSCVGSGPLMTSVVSAGPFGTLEIVLRD